MTEIIAESQVISAGLSPHKMLLATAVPGKGFKQAIAPPGLEALLLLKVQLVIIGAEFLNEIAPPLTAAVLLLKMQLSIHGSSAVLNASPPPFRPDVLFLMMQLVMIGLENGEA